MPAASTSTDGEIFLSCVPAPTSAPPATCNLVTAISFVFTAMRHVHGEPRLPPCRCDRSQDLDEICQSGHSMDPGVDFEGRRDLPFLWIDTVKTRRARPLVKASTLRWVEGSSPPVSSVDSAPPSQWAGFSGLRTSGFSHPQKIV